MPNNNPPFVSVVPEVVAINGQLLFRDMFTVTDIDNLPNDPSEVLLYRFRDNTTGSGNFAIGGAIQNPNEWIEITALQLSSVSYRGDSKKSQETYSVQVYDGVFWSNVATSTITTGNSSPVLTVLNGRVAPLEKTAITKQFTVADADGDSILRYQFIDRSINTNGGHFLLRGQRIASGQYFFVEAGDLATIEYRGGQVAGQTENISMSVYDGFSWSAEQTFAMATTQKSVITPTPVEIVAQEKRLATKLFTITDGDGDLPVAYTMIDRRINADGGYFELNGQRLESGKFFTVLARDINRLFYVGGNTGPQTEQVGIQVYDGFEFSNITNISVTTTPRPAVSGGNVSIQANHYLNFATGAKVNTIGLADPNATPVLNFTSNAEKFLFIDRAANSNGGYFIFKGARLPSAKYFTVDVADLPQLEYRGGLFGPQSEQVSVQILASGIWSSESTFTVSTLKNSFRPDLKLFDANSKVGSVLSLQSLFSASDKDGDLLTRFGVYDTGGGPPGGPDDTGYFTVNGVRQPALTWIVLDYDQVNTVRYHMPSQAGFERINMFVSDGRLVSTTQGASMRAIVTPVIETVDNDISVDTLEGISAGSLISQTDGGPALVRYEVFDENFRNIPDRSGRLFLRQPGAGNDGEELQGGIVHTLTAEEFTRLELQGAEVDFGRQLDGILIRATNGVTGWSDWTRINVNTDPVGADSLTTPFKFDADISGPKTVVTYTFIDGGNQSGGTVQDPKLPPLPSYYIGRDESIGTRAFDRDMRESIRDTLAYFETVANIDFVELPYEITASQAAITFGAWDFTGSLASAAAYAYFPTDGDGRGNNRGDIWFDTKDFPINNTPTGFGSAFRFTAFHEIGHSLGMKHPFEGTPALSIFNNFQYNTVMAYNETDSNDPLPDHPSGFPNTLMLYDLVELQRVYGANTTHNTVNNHYFYNLTDSFQQTLWDAGGIDTINMTNHTAGETIDLREGTWSSINGVQQSLRIAYGTKIENARGGSGKDVLTGNETDNLLFGNAGNDLIRGGGGNDTLRGGTDSDKYVWSLGDGHDLIIEEKSIDADLTDNKIPFEIIEFYDPSGSITSLQDDFVFRRFGNDLRIDFSPDLGASQGSITVQNFANTDMQVEKLRIHGLGGTKIGGDIDLTSVFAFTDSSQKRFQVTQQTGTYGFLVAPV